MFERWGLTQHLAIQKNLLNKAAFKSKRSVKNLVTSFVYKCQRAGFPNLACDQQVAPATRKAAKLLTGVKSPSKPFEFTTQAWRQQAKGKASTW